MKNSVINTKCKAVIILFVKAKSDLVHGVHKQQFLRSASSCLFVEQINLIT